MIRSLKLLSLLSLLSLLFASACDSQRSVRIGAKAFTEQRILASALRTLVEDTGRTARVVECGDPFACQQALRGGQIDVLVEYAGTAALYAGLDPSVDQQTVADAYRAQGIELVKPLGFDNGYRLIVARNTDRSEVRTLSDLAALGELTIAVNASYARRARDGLPALAERYGLRATPVILDSSAERVAAVLSGSADVAVVFATDGALKGAAISILEDNEGFFPDYSAHVFARTDALGDTTRALAELTVSAEQIREANFSVDVQGYSPREAARVLIAKEGGEVANALKIVAPAANQWPQAESAARRAVRSAFPGRPVVFARAGDPLTFMDAGKSRLALVPASRFYVQRRNKKWKRDTRAEALVVIGREVLHLVAREAGPLKKGAKVGAPIGGGDERTLMRALGLGRPAGFASQTGLLENVASGTLDAAAILAEPGDAQIARALQNGLRLASPVGTLAEPLPFIRPARLPPSTYARQLEPVETWSIQIVLAGPSARAERMAGPAGALVSAAPLDVNELRRLEAAQDVIEQPDPSLPVPWSRHLPSSSTETPLRALFNRLLGAGAILFLIWVFRLSTSR